MHRLKQIYHPVALAMLACGCVPFPNLHYYAPAATGVITQNGSPVVGAQVFVSSQFSSESTMAVTGTDGRFAVEPIREILLIVTMIGDPLIAYSIKIMVGGKVYEGYSDNSMGYVPKTVELKCDLSHPLKHWDRQIYCTK